MQLTAAISEDGNCFVARCLEVEVASQGSTQEEALENLKEALELFFEGDGVPPTSSHPVVKSFQLSAGAQLFPS